MNFLDSMAPHAHWLVRLSLGATYIYHGIGKFPIKQGFADLVGSTAVAYAVGLGEILAGAALIAGALMGDMITRLGGLGVVIIMLGAIPLAHLGQGWGGMEFQVLMLVVGLYFLAKGNKA